VKESIQKNKFKIPDRFKPLIPDRFKPLIPDRFKPLIPQDVPHLGFGRSHVSSHSFTNSQ